MTTLIAFIVTIGVLVTIHEYGHYQVARWCGVKVLRFSVGFGQPLWRKTYGRDKTEFVLAAIPLGGYVKMLDEREQSEEGMLANYSEDELKRAFNRQSVWKRIAITIAGPAANLLLAIFIYWLLFLSGVTGMRPIIGVVEGNSRAAQASLTTGEVIQKIDGKHVTTWQEARLELLEKSLDVNSVEIQTVNEHNELYLHTLNLGNMSQDSEIDILKKIGVQPFRPTINAEIDEVLPDSAAERAGLKPHDKVLSIDNVTISDWEEMVSTVNASPGKQLVFKVARGEQIIKILVTPEPTEDNQKTIGKIGASPYVDKTTLSQLLVEARYGIFAALAKATQKTWETAVFSLKMLWNMLLGKVSWKGISGPVTIADYAGKSANMGWKTFVGFLALVSISIGVLNLLPIPVLDGGHLMYYTAEILKGSPVSDQSMLLGQKIGFAILGLLMTIAIFNDLNRLVAG